MRSRAIYRSLKYAWKKKKGRKEGRKKTFLERRFAEQVIGPQPWLTRLSSRLVERARFRLGEIGRHADWNLLIGCLIEMGSSGGGYIFVLEIGRIVFFEK